MQPWSHTVYFWRVRNRLSQQRAADRVGVSLTTWGRWERGVTEPSDDLVRECRRVMSGPAAARRPDQGGQADA